MTYRPLLLPVLVLAAAPLSAGCLCIAEKERVVRANEPRVIVDFESEEGLIAFQSSVISRDTLRSRRQGSSDVLIPFLLNVETSSVLSDTAYYNDQVAMADVNRDGVLSDAEVSGFTGRRVPSQMRLSEPEVPTRASDIDIVPTDAASPRSPENRPADNALPE